jgi:hypothetical protein
LSRERSISACQPRPGLVGHAVDPGRVKLVAAVFLDELAAVDARLVGQLHHAAVDRHDPAVDPVKLVDQRLDPVVVQVQLVHQFHDLGAELLVDLLVLPGEAAILVQRGRDALVLHFGKVDVILRDAVERFQDAGLQRRFHGREAHVGLVVLVVVVILGDGVAVRVQFRLVLGLLGGFGVGIGDGRHHRFVVVLAHATAEGGVEVDDVAQQDVLVEKFVAPDGDRLEGQRAFAKARDHRVASGLDPLGDGDLALAAQQFDRPHLAQVHAHRVVGAVELLGLGRGDGHLAAGGRFDHLGRALLLAVILGFLVLDDVDAHFAEHRHHVLDLLGADLIGRKDGVELVVGDVPRAWPRRSSS